MPIVAPWGLPAAGTAASTQDVARRVARAGASVALFALCIVWILSTLVGHDPWKPDEAYSFGLVLDFMERHDWVVPMLAGEPFLEKPPLFYIVASAFAALFRSALPLHDGARLASGFFLGVALLFLALSARRLHGRRHGWTAVVMMLGCLGLAVRAHQLITDLALLAGMSVGIYGLACAKEHSFRGGIALGVGATIAFLSKGLLGPGMLGVSALAVLSLRGWRNRTYRKALVIAALVALPGTFAWAAALYLRSPDLFRTWLVTNNFGRFFGLTDIGPHQPRFFYAYTLIWYAFPALPVAAWTAWVAWRDRGAGRDDSGIQFPILVFMVMVSVLGAASDARELYLMPTLLPLALLATARIDQLPAPAASALARLGNVTFGLLAIALWLGWIALLTGAPSTLSRVLAERQPGFVARFDEVGFAAALLATGAWSWLLRQPVRNAQRGIVQWTAGLTLCLSLVGALWLPYIDAGKSYRAMIHSLGGALHGPRCVASRALGEPQRALLHYFAGLDTVREEVVPDPQCDVLLVQGWRSSGSPAPARGWTPLWQGARPGDDNELYRLYVRADPTVPPVAAATRPVPASGAPVRGILRPVHARFAASGDRHGARARTSGDSAAAHPGSESYADPMFDPSRDRRR